MGELSGRFDGWLSFQDRLLAGMAVAAVQPADLIFCDVDFKHWPMGSVSMLDAFHQWVMASSVAQCRLMAAHFDEMPRRHPRWLAWRQPWGHRVKCLQMPEDVAQSVVPTFIVKDQLGIRVIDSLTGAGLWTRDIGTVREWTLEVDVISQQCHEAMPSTTLGL